RAGARSIRDRAGGAVGSGGAGAGARRRLAGPLAVAAVERRAGHPGAAAGVAHAIVDAVLLILVRRRGTIVVPVEDAVGVLVDGGGIDAELDPQRLSVDERRVFVAIDGAELLLI